MIIYLPTRGFEGGRIALGRTQSFLNAIIHSPDVSCYGGCLYILAELCPILVCTSPRGLLNIAPGSSDNPQVSFTGWPFVLHQGGALSLDDRPHFGRLGVKLIVSLLGIFAAGNQGCAVHGVSENFPLLCGRNFGLWGIELFLKSLRKLWHEVWLWHLADLYTRVTLFLSAMEPLWLQYDLATHQGVVCVAISAVVRARV